MEFQHVNIKLFLKNPGAVDLETLVPVFHSWIQNQGLDELLLDIADYRHVPEGPGVVLIGHRGNYSLDNAGGRLGVRYNRKVPLEGTNYDRLVQATQAALAACQHLESEPSLNGRIRFNGHEIEVSLIDRLLTPNTPETRAAADTDLREFFSNLFGVTDYAVTHAQDPRRLFSFHVKASQEFSTADLLDSLKSLTRAPK